jgi:hypothetical protein
VYARRVASRARALAAAPRARARRPAGAALPGASSEGSEFVGVRAAMGEPPTKKARGGATGAADRGNEKSPTLVEVKETAGSAAGRGLFTTVPGSTQSICDVASLVYYTDQCCTGILSLLCVYVYVC